jgi:hypothetical protein
MDCFRRSLFLRTITSLFVIVFAFCLARPVWAIDPQNIVTYQGRILDGNGVPVADASLDMVFKLVDDSSGTTCYWSNSDTACATATDMTVTLTDGLFSVNLGDTGDGFAAIADSVFGDDESVYLEVIIEGETLLPRKLITAAPYAISAQTLDGFDSSEFLMTTGGTGTGDYDFSGSVFGGAIPLVFEGLTANAFETSFAITNPTADNTITFQDATGTVAYLSDITASASKWTDGGTTTYLTSLTDDLAVGGTTASGSAFGVDVSAMQAFIGDGATTDGVLTIQASDGTAGSITYNSAGFAITPVIGDIISVGGDVVPSSDATFDLGSVSNGWAKFYIDNTDDTTIVALDADGASESTSGASAVGVFNEFANSSGGNVQDTLDDLDNAITVGGAGAMWTDAGAATYLTSTTDDFLIGGTSVTSAPFAVDESADSVYIGEGNTANGNIIFKASDGATGTLTYTTSDLYYFAGGDVFIGASSVSGVNAGFVPNGDDLYVEGDIAAQDKIYADEFVAGDSSTYYSNGSMTSSTAYILNAATSFTFRDDAANTLATLTDAGTTGNLSVTNNITATGDLAVNGGDVTTTATTWNFDVGNTGQIYFRDSVGNTLGRFIDAGTTGNLEVTNDITASGDLAVDGGDITTLSTAWNFDVGDTGTISFRDDSANVLATLTDAGTTGNLSVTNNITATGDLAVNGGDVTTTATTWNFDVGNTGTINFRDGTNTLFLIKDNGSTGDIESTGDLFVDGGNIDSLLSNPLILNATAADEVRIGNGFGTLSTGAGDLFVTGDVESAGNIDIFAHGAFGGGASVDTEKIINLNESMASGAGFTYKNGLSITNFVTGAGGGTNVYGANIYTENQTTAGTIVKLAGLNIVAQENGVGSTVTDLMGIDATGSMIAGNAARAYGIRATASGATTNFAGYFYGAPTRIENNTTPSSPAFATGAGDLYIYDQLEIDGTVGGGETVMDVRPASLSTGIGGAFTFNALTTGIGLVVSRPTSGSNFTNTSTGLVDFVISDNGSSGDLLSLRQAGTGKIFDFQSTQGTPGFMGTMFNDGNTDTNGGISIQACTDGASPTTACNLIRFLNGDASVTLGTIEGNGGGSAQFTAPGGDYAELFDGTFADFSTGDLIGIKTDGSVEVASDPMKVIGALSVNRLILGNAEEENWEALGTYVPVAMLGQVPVKVNTENGAISVGDYLVLSSTAGEAMKANGVGYTIGRALEDAVADSTISVFVQPGWQAQDVLLADGSATDVLTDLNISGNLTIDDVAGTTMAQITDSGDLAISGHLYPSDEGTLQTDKYIYYDGGGDFMRTNAAGWATGSYDFAEMFPSEQPLVPGEVVVFASDDEHVSRSTGITYDERIAGIISTRPGFLAGEDREGDVAVALAGRVPTFVSGENGDIAVGDPLTTSTRAGYAMKATTAGQIVGYAMEPFSGVTGVVVAVVRPSYYAGGPVEDVPEVETSASGVMTVAGLDVNGALNMNSGRIENIGSLIGIGDAWRIEDNGDFRTHGRLISLVNSYQNEDVETYAVTSSETTIQLSGTATLQAGSAAVIFEDVDPAFNDVISNTAPYRVFLTPSAQTGQLFAMNRTANGFEIQDPAGTSGVTIDWIVVAYHKDFAPAETVEVAPADPAVEPVVTETPVPVIEEPMAEPTTDLVIDPAIFETPAEDPAVVPEPDPVPEPQPVVEPEPTVTIDPSTETVVSEPDPSVTP